MTWYVVTYPHIAGWAIYRHINLFFFDLQYTGILHRYPQSLRYVTIRDRYHRRYAYRPSYIWGGISRRHRYALSMWYICGNILLRIFRHISVYITYTVAYFDILFEFRMFSEYHFSDMEIYHITNFTRITRILLSILLILLISSFRGKSSTRLGGNHLSSLVFSPGKFRPSSGSRTGLIADVATHSLDPRLRPVPFPCATCRPPPMQPCCDACFVSQC